MRNCGPRSINDQGRHARVVTRAVTMEPIVVPLAGAASVGDGAMVAADMGGRPLVVANAGGRYWVFARECPHETADLLDGVVDDGTVTCPNHGYVFDLETGECLVPGGCPPLAVVATEVRDEMICVRIDLSGS